MKPTEKLKDMKLNDEQLRALWQTAAPVAARGECLSDDFLLRAGADDLTFTEREQLAAHLANCPACVEAWRIARAAFTWAEDTARDLAPQPVTPPVPGWRERFADWLSVPSLAMAAALLLTTIGLGVWTRALMQERQALQARVHKQQDELAEVPALREQLNAAQNDGQTTASTLTAENSRLREELVALTQPQLEVPIIDADPVNLTRGSGSSTVTRVEVPPSAQMFTVILHLSQEPASKDLLIEWREAQSKKELWRREVKKGDAPNLTLTLARRNVPAGKYRVVIATAKGKPLDQFDVEVVYQSAAKK